MLQISCHFLSILQFGSLSFVPYFKVVIESLMDAKSWGDIAVDDIKVLNGLSMAECKGEAFSTLTLPG